MTGKPSTIQGYGGDSLARVRSTCLYVATRLGDLLDDIVVVGGLVPSLLVDQEEPVPGVEAHAGTLDLDMGLALGDSSRGAVPCPWGKASGCRLRAGHERVRKQDPSEVEDGFQSLGHDRLPDSSK